MVMESILESKKGILFPYLKPFMVTGQGWPDESSSDNYYFNQARVGLLAYTFGGGEKYS